MSWESEFEHLPATPEDVQRVLEFIELQELDMDKDLPGKHARICRIGLAELELLGMALSMYTQAVGGTIQMAMAKFLGP